MICNFYPKLDALKFFDTCSFEIQICVSDLTLCTFQFISTEIYSNQAFMQFIGVQRAFNKVTMQVRFRRESWKQDELKTKYNTNEFNRLLHTMTKILVTVLETCSSTDKKY